MVTITLLAYCQACGLPGAGKITCSKRHKRILTLWRDIVDVIVGKLGEIAILIYLGLSMIS